MAPRSSQAAAAVPALRLAKGQVIIADMTADAAVEQIMRDAGKRVPDEVTTEDGLATA